MRLRKGDKVRPSQEAKKANIHPQDRDGIITGTVTGFQYDGLVKVRREGNIFPTCYHQSFWEKI